MRAAGDSWWSGSRGRVVRAVPAIVWAALIFAVSSVPGKSLPGGFSVQGHLFEYLVFGGLVVVALGGPGRTRALPWIALALSALYAASDEFHQAFVPGRMPDPLDWTADIVGASAGILTVLLLARWRASRRERG